MCHCERQGAASTYPGALAAWSTTANFKAL